MSKKIVGDLVMPEVKWKPKGPKVPVFPERTQALVQELHRIIDTGLKEVVPSDDSHLLAYALLTRLSVLWVDRTEPFKVQTNLKGNEFTLAPENGELLNSAIILLASLFPAGHPWEQDEATP